ncbi:MAG: PrsW family intramembrane metalloprotease [Cryobacterium sp.]|uniref:PrsW family intramembrane metalloprotease n=1 Tax=unclassified Cryobacterium TaxID=2649013 RepID=UPI001A2111C9|nr:MULTISPECIES: PrsW family intramembrane metalloprotease [unclassified Cryobacterium]MCY7405702.1 PrsW family intramembrane metalloprotease [Cryobacterium sp.]MEC5155130.1 RsiW-degrading membrane proteinase PrsW (M82 family) [Cryobacterium sp. CAN_C3]
MQPSPNPVQQVWSRPVPPRRTGRIVVAFVGIVLAGLALLAVFAYLTTFLGTGALLFGLLLALLPLAVVLFAVRWMDRWDPEPRPALIFALLWGAGISIVTALVFDLGVQITIAASAGSLTGSDFASAVIQAPIVEEVAKGFGVLVLFWAVRRHFDGPLDGVVYAATIAAGFAFSENIQYFGLAMTEGNAQSLGITFLLRGVFSPFAHVTFTICTGLALGLAARRSATKSGVVGYFLLGLMPAIALHALWNGSTFVLTGDASVLFYYVIVQVPLFVAAVLIVVFLRRQEARITLRRLHEYSQAGWFTPAEVSMLGTGAGRRQALAWGRHQERPKKLATRHFIADATRLAFVRDRLVRGQSTPALHALEARLLELLMNHRADMLGHTLPGSGPPEQ